MAKLGIERSYASALIDVAIEANKEAEITADFKALSVVMKENPELLKLLISPTVSKNEKHEVLNNILGGKIDDELDSFLHVLIDNGRFQAWNEIVKCYQDILDEKQGIVRGIAYSVQLLGKDTLAKLEESVSATVGQKVVLDNRVDTSIIGGVKVYVDGKLIDASYKRGLEKIKKAFVV